MATTIARDGLQGTKERPPVQATVRPVAELTKEVIESALDLADRLRIPKEQMQQVFDSPDSVISPRTKKLFAELILRYDRTLALYESTYSDEVAARIKVRGMHFVKNINQILEEAAISAFDVEDIKVMPVIPESEALLAGSARK